MGAEGEGATAEGGAEGARLHPVLVIEDGAVVVNLVVTKRE
jgi:hypothetical protein